MTLFVVGCLLAVPLGLLMTLVAMVEPSALNCLKLPPLDVSIESFQTVIWFTLSMVGGLLVGAFILNS